MKRPYRHKLLFVAIICGLVGVTQFQTFQEKLKGHHPTLPIPRAIEVNQGKETNLQPSVPIVSSGSAARIQEGDNPNSNRSRFDGALAAKLRLQQPKETVATKMMATFSPEELGALARIQKATGKPAPSSVLKIFELQRNGSPRHQIEQAILETFRGDLFVRAELLGWLEKTTGRNHVGDSKAKPKGTSAPILGVTSKLKTIDSPSN